MARSVARVAEPVPFSAINVTPFIDVMLVLLIVMILSIPIATQKVPLDLPTLTPDGKADPLPPAVLAIDKQGALTWDGTAISDAALPARLTALQQSGAPLHLWTDPEARYERFDGVLATVKRAGVTKLGFVNNRPLAD
jgi:biopolymer transport protein ExbD